MRIKKKLAILILMATSVLIFSTKFEVGLLQGFAKERYEDLQLFTKVLNLVQQYYVIEVDTSRLVEGAINGMLKELDPHTYYLNKEIYADFENETSGKFGGLGVEITIRDEVLTVISPIEDTPAWKAGIKAGDIIIEIDGESTKGITLPETAEKMSGENGTEIILSIIRHGFSAPIKYTVKRGEIKIKSVKYTDLQDGYGYFKMTSFIKTTYDELKQKIAEHKKKHKNLKGMILDLRKNPGGLLAQAVKVSDLFLSEGKIVSTIGRDKKAVEVLYAKKHNTLESFPLLVLIDEYSASASEIVASALQDNKRALIIGKKSFGKGSVQSVVKLGDKGGLKLTVARYFTPNGRAIQAEGVIPDVEVDDIDTKTLTKAIKKRRIRREKDIKGHLLGKKELEQKKTQSNQFKLWWLATEDKSKKLTRRDKLLKKDFQLFQAFNYLKAWKVMKGI